MKNTELEINAVKELRRESDFKVYEILPFTSINSEIYYADNLNDHVEEKVEFDEEILKQIRRIKTKHPEYGYRTVTNELHKSGYQVNHKRVFRLMKKDNLTVKKNEYQVDY
ncbi:IS3 family transposase [Companilactobacillus halodurans]|uniref:Transposase n=1 Tax=Companilactobacillus halodurans TaxID=2584183 RepID=A0A5P0ZWS4_9LACO|nr:IS3 family transposase [Companilactobacillus halodurans]MQS75191.1 transposase [Companilactobacillus halodurans]MQS97543.1 transposase [Companilactobacillus halodurans]